MRPDGRRDRDVVIEGTAEGKRRHVLIECKDFNPNSTGPVGIGYVDALESKHRDLGMDVSFICSNAGFTTCAIRKVKPPVLARLGSPVARDRLPLCPQKRTKLRVTAGVRS